MILIGFQPAGKMEAFFQEAAKISDFAAEVLGAPLAELHCE